MPRATAPAIHWRSSLSAVEHDAGAGHREDGRGRRWRRRADERRPAPREHEHEARASPEHCGGPGQRRGEDGECADQSPPTARARGGDGLGEGARRLGDGLGRPGGLAGTGRRIVVRHGRHCASPAGERRQDLERRPVGQHRRGGGAPVEQEGRDARDPGKLRMRRDAAAADDGHRGSAPRPTSSPPRRQPAPPPSSARSPSLPSVAHLGLSPVSRVSSCIRSLSRRTSVAYPAGDGPTAAADQRAAPSAEVLPALGLLSHPVRILPAEATALVDSPDCDIVIVDARRELASARSLCRVLRTTGIATPAGRPHRGRPCRPHGRVGPRRRAARLGRSGGGRRRLAWP